MITHRLVDTEENTNTNAKTNINFWIPIKRNVSQTQLVLQFVQVNRKYRILRYVHVLQSIDPPRTRRTLEDIRSFENSWSNENNYLLKIEFSGDPQASSHSNFNSDVWINYCTVNPRSDSVTIRVSIKLSFTRCLLFVVMPCESGNYIVFRLILMRLVEEDFSTFDSFDSLVNCNRIHWPKIDWLIKFQQFTFYAVK